MADNMLTVAFVFLASAVVINLGRLWKLSSWLDRAIPTLMYASALLLGGIILLRMTEALRMPFANMYEFSVLMALIVIAAHLLLRRTIDTPLFDLAVALLLTLLLSILSTLPAELRPLMPALQSRWLHAHVATAILAYSAFAMAFCLGIIYLVKDPVTESELKNLDGKIYKSVVWGFTLLTLVIITGAVWAEEVWGNWWSWDPKETWSLVTWVVYASYLHARRTSEWRGRRSAWLVVIGFIVVLFTLFGVSILLPGLHSYA